MRFTEKKFKEIQKILDFYGLRRGVSQDLEQIEMILVAFNLGQQDGADESDYLKKWIRDKK